MLIESYVVEFKEIKKCLASMDINDFCLISENIFSLSESTKSLQTDLLSDHTPNNHPEVMLLINKDYARNLILNDESFEFLKKSHDIHNLNGVTLHLAFAHTELLNDLQLNCKKRTIDGITVQHANHEALLMTKQGIERKHKDNLSILNKSITVYTH